MNQYTQRTVPGIIPIVGKASADATVSVKLPSRGTAANAITRAARYPSARPGETYFVAPIAVDNSTSAVTEQLDINAIKFDHAQDKDVIRTVSGSYTVPQTPQSFTYDADGNMLSDGQWTYTWNGENRLVSTTKNTNDTKIEFAYDYQGRRFSKKTYSWTGSAWQLDATEKYVWDNYNRIAIFDGSNVLQRSLLYGEDINGGIGTAGGVGGLLAVTDHPASKTYLPCYDGNGNVRVYIDSADGGVAAEYEYSPSPELISKVGTKADELAQVASFSTMPYDKELDAFFYPMRVVKYGRFLSHDPKDEPGFITLTGINLNNGYEPEYVLVNNNIVDKWDLFGLAYFAYRPLDSFIGRLVGVTGNKLDDWMNTMIAHEQLFFEDGKSPENLGFFDDNRVRLDKSSLKYKTGHDAGWNDCVIRKAVANVKSSPYCLLGKPGSTEKYNCQDWADAVRKEYRKLIKDKKIVRQCCPTETEKNK